SGARSGCFWGGVVAWAVGGGGAWGGGADRRYGVRVLPVFRHGHADQGVDLLAVNRLFLQQKVGQRGEFRAVSPDQRDGGLLGLTEQAGHLSVDDGLGGLGKGPAGQPGAAAAEEH